MGKCFICGEEVPMDHACLNAQVHMRCEGKLADFARLRAECERLRAGNKVLMSHDDTIRASQAKGKRLEARVRELEATLRPFADLYESTKDLHDRAAPRYVYLEDLYRAAAALKDGP